MDCSGLKNMHPTMIESSMMNFNINISVFIGNLTGSISNG